MSDTILLVKQSASHLKKYVFDNFKVKLKTGHAQQLVSAAFGFKSYQSLITTKKLTLHTNSARNLPAIKDLPKSAEKIANRLIAIPEIKEELLTVSDELAEEVLLGVLPKCLACGLCEELRWPFAIGDDVHWCCNKCAKLGHLESSIDKLLTEFYIKVNVTTLPISRLVAIHKINIMPNQVELALEGDYKKWDGMISKVTQWTKAI